MNVYTFFGSFSAKLSLFTFVFLAGCYQYRDADVIYRDCEPWSGEQITPGLCGSDYYYDPSDWDADQIMQFWEVELFWRSVGADIRVHPGQEGGCKIERGSLPQHVLAWYRWKDLQEPMEPHIVLDTEKIRPEIFYQVFAHEIGHSLGFHHDSSGLMCSSVRYPSQLSPELLGDQCTQLGYCNAPESLD